MAHNIAGKTRAGIISRPGHRMERKSFIMKQQFLTALLLLGFLVGIHNGYVAVWKDEDPQPI